MADTVVASPPVLAPALPDPAAALAWQQYLAECARLGVRDLAGLELAHVAPYIGLNQYQRDQLARTVPTAPYRLYRSAVEIVERNLCPACWLLRNTCMCDALRDARYHTRHKVFILMHHMEFGRGSNTGKLAVRASSSEASPTANPTAVDSAASISDVSRTLTAASAFIQTDISVQERALFDLCEREPLNTVVLFPSEDSITIDEFVQQRGWFLPVDSFDDHAESTRAAAATTGSAATAAASTASSALPVCPPLNIILLDGTWRQARSMKFLLPKHIPAIRIDPFKYRLDGTLRPPPPEPSEEEKAALAKEAAQAAAEDAAEAAAAVPTDKKSRSKLSHRDPAHLKGKVAPSPAPNAATDVTDGTATPARTFVSLFYPLRKQSQPDRISTIEALVILLKDLHEPDRVTHRLLDLLRTLVDSMRVQTGMNSVYGTYTKEEARRMRAEVALGQSKALVAAGADGALIVGPKGSLIPAPTSGGPMTNATPLETNSVAAVSPSPPVARVTRRERSQRTTAMRPCLQWNRGQSNGCTHTPCRFAHTCMLCNGTHRALECAQTQAAKARLEQTAALYGGQIVPIRGTEAMPQAPLCASNS